MAGEYLSTDSEMFPGGVQSSLVIKVDECGCLEEGCNPDCYTSNAQVQYIRMNQLEIFPNPASDFVRINFDAQAGRLKIFNQQAQLCIDKTYNAGAELDLSDLTSGLYTVRVNADGKFYWGQFVKE
ncbi:MAG: T9SS type A sorting domain-containing protein [Bacteroidota bacterium]|nr:T9SS type A sorting domain-containing protein [Bacteroidota bacterium]